MSINRRTSSITEKQLKELYLQYKMPIHKIAETLECDPETISRKLKFYDIPLRTHSESLSGRKFTERTKLKDVTKEQLDRMYNDEWLTTVQIAKRHNCTNGLVLLKLREFGIPQHTSRIKGLDKPNLYRMYIKERLSMNRIADMLGVNDETVRKAIKRYGINIRSRSEAGKNKEFTEEHLNKIRENAKLLPRPESGSKHPAWKGGRSINRWGYVTIRVYENDNPRSKVVLEHRYVMEQQLGRKLEPWEEVNHINGIKTDNRPENLEVIHSEHKRKDWHRRNGKPLDT